MQKVAEFVSKINTIFDKKQIEEMGKETKLIVRDRKISPVTLLQSLMQLSLMPNHSLEALANILYDLKIKVSRQAIHKKTGGECLQFCKIFLDKLIRTIIPQGLPVKDLKEIIVVDSSKINKQKLQMVVDIIGKSINSLEFTELNNNDQTYRNYLKFAGKDVLIIADLGYFCIDSITKIAQKSGLFLLRYYRKASLQDSSGKNLDLNKLLESTENVVDMEVKLTKQRFKCRLVAIKLTEEQQKLRDDHIKRKQKRDLRLSGISVELDKWNIFITNLGEEFKPDACYNLYAARWQVEILFKAMKSRSLMIDKVNTKSGLGKILVYVKLIMVVLTLKIGSLVDNFEDISYEKLCMRMCNYLEEFIGRLGNWTLHLIKRTTEKIKTFCKISAYKSRPSSLQKVRNYA